MRTTLNLQRIAVLAIVLWSACEGEGVLPPDRSDQAQAVERLSDAQAQSLGDAELRGYVARVSAKLASATGPEAIELALSAAHAGRALTRRTADVGYAKSAATVLRDLALRGAGANACVALLEAARIHAVDLAQPVEAERGAVDVVARFSDDATCRACVVDAQRLVDTLADHPSVRAAASQRARATPPVDATNVSQATTSATPNAWLQASTPMTASEPATLERVMVYGGRAGTRVVRAVLYFDRPVTYQGGEAIAEAGLPRRLFLDFDALRVAPTVQASATIGVAGLQRIRVLRLDADVPQDRAARTRISFDVDAAAAHRAFVLTDPYRVLVDLQVGRDEEEASTRVRTIVLDPGHGGRNTGAHGPHGLREAVVALDLSRRVRALLKHELPGTRIVLTREGHEDLSLEERTAIANGENAQLFVSIHLNAWATADQGGVATFVLDTSDDSQALRLAARENGTEVEQISELQKVLAGLYRQEQVGHSLRLAESIHQATLQSGRSILPELVDRGVKRAMFYVLVGATMPAVLVEPSFITNPAEAQALTTDAYRDKLAAGIALGIAKYARSL